MKKLLLTLMALLMATSLAACSKPSEEGGSTSAAQEAINYDAEIKEKVGFNEYERLYREADAITDDLDARYAAYAKADSYLIEKALFVPSSQNARSLIVSKFEPFSQQYAGTGLAEYKYKNLRLRDEVVTLAEYDEAYAKWQAGAGLPEVTRAEYTGPTEMTVPTSREVQSMDYVITALATDHELNANFVEGLLQNDSYGNFVPGIAESYEVNEDSTVYTFHLRKGVNWTTSTGEVYGEVKAQDFVTGLRHGAEFNSGTAWLMQGTVKGYAEYMENGEFTDEAWAEVGVKALDDYTVEYTLETSVPYFHTMTTYAVLFPVNEEFLTSKGTGCALGAPDQAACEFGTASADSILYNSAYLLGSYDSKSQTTLVKNPNYWDLDHVFLDKVVRIYNDGSDPYSVIKGFEQGTYASAGLSTSWSDYADYAAKYADYAHPSLPNSTVFGVVFNFNRQVHNETMNTPEEQANTHKAILSENFRKALRAAYDKQAYLETSTPKEVAITTLRNINNFPEVVKLSDGTPYGTLVANTYKETTGEDVDLTDGRDAFFNPDAVQGYIDAAKEEGVAFPVKLDMLVIETSDSLVKQAQSMKDSVEKNSNGQIVINLVMRDADTVQNIAYYNTDPALSDYDISTFTGWSPDYADPKSFVDIYSPTTGYYMTSCGLLNNDTIAALQAQAALEE